MTGEPSGSLPIVRVPRIKSFNDVIKARKTREAAHLNRSSSAYRSGGALGHVLHRPGTRVGREAARRVESWTPPVWPWRPPRQEQGGGGRRSR